MIGSHRRDTAGSGKALQDWKGTAEQGEGRQRRHGVASSGLMWTGEEVQARHGEACSGGD